MKEMHKEYMKPLLIEWNFLDWNYPRKRHEYFHLEDTVIQEKHFDFLGFTHFNSKTRKGYYSVGHKISRKKKKQFKSNLKKWVKENRNTQFDEFMKALNKKLTGSFNYYSLSGMIKEVRNLWQHSLYVTFKWLNRRSQRRSFKLERFFEMWQERIIHPYIHVDI